MSFICHPYFQIQFSLKGFLGYSHVLTKICSLYQFLQHENGRPLPKFGEWDVNDPASAEGFTVIFNKARDERKTGGNTKAASPPKNAAPKQNDDFNYPKKVMLCIDEFNFSKGNQEFYFLLFCHGI